MNTEPDIQVLPDIEAESRDQLAPLWKVVCHDDPITTMDFVIDVLTHVFRQPMARAVELMYQVHYSGSATVGLWPESVAKRKVARAHAMARAGGFPLTFSVEEEA